MASILYWILSFNKNVSRELNMASGLILKHIISDNGKYNNLLKSGEYLYCTRGIDGIDSYTFNNDGKLFFQ